MQQCEALFVDNVNDPDVLSEANQIVDELALLIAFNILGASLCCLCDVVSGTLRLRVTWGSPLRSQERLELVFV